jgi:hypothetical protein
MGTLITTAGIIAICMLNWENEESALVVCSIIGAILTIPGAFFGVLASGWGLSLKILFSSTLGELFNNVITSAIIWAIRFFFLPYIVAVIIFVIVA